MYDPHQREVAVYEAAMQLPPEQREGYLEQTCAGDLELLQRMRALLNANESKTDFLVSPAFAARPALADSLQPTEQTGERIGPYKLLQQIGEGGCGVVYMAEQEEPIRRRVALKVIKLGMDTRQVIARFEAERQALALMDHPNIAKVHDAGATATGRPYFVMELVRGLKITDYCDEKELSTRQRLDLFVLVCGAIQHAHQKGIIHRDIKPSNILVTVNDGVAVPKVIDFGIAKATTGERLTDMTVFTAFEQFIGTPAYVSPEQAEITSVDVDTRSDIYSLGVLLYELLTGQTPFDARELLQAGLDEMRRTIREKEPERPSTRVSSLSGEELTTAANRRGLDPPRLVNLLRGDLDWIVMKCLEKDRARRYETASGLASDVRRHLGNEAVIACPPSNFYRFRKLVNRNKLAFAAAGAIAASLLIGLSVSTWMFFQERAARLEQVRLRREAEMARNNESVQRHLALASEKKALDNEARALAESAKSAQVAQLWKKTLQGVDPEVAMGMDTTLLHHILDTTSTNILFALKNQPEAQAELLDTIGYVYLSIGDDKKGEEMCGLSVALRRALPMRAIALAASLKDLGMALRNQGKWGAAQEALEEALDLLRNVPWTNDLTLPNVLFELSTVLGHFDREADAERFLKEALGLFRQMGTNALPEVAGSLRGLSEIRRKQEKLREAEEYARESLRLTQEVGSMPQIAWCWGELAAVMRSASRGPEAEHCYREALAIQRKAYPKGNSMLLPSLLLLGSTLWGEGKAPESEPYLREAVEIQKSMEPGIDSIWPPLRLAGLARERGQTEEAESLERDALTRLCRFALVCEDRLQSLVAFTFCEDWGSVQNEIDGFGWCRKAAESFNPTGLNQVAWLLATWPDPCARNAADAISFGEAAAAATSRKDPSILHTLAAAYAENGQFERAVGVQEEALRLVQSEALRKELEAHLKLFKAWQPVRDSSSDGEVADALDWLVHSLLLRGKAQKAEPPARKCLALREREAPHDWRSFQSRTQLGACLLEQKKYAEAEGLLLSGYEGMKQCTNRIPPRAWARQREAAWRLARLYEQTGRTEKAAEWKQKLSELDAKK